MSSRFAGSSSSSRRLFLARLNTNLVEHVLPAQRFCDTFRFVLSQRVVGIDGRDLKDALVQHHDTQRTKRYAGRNLNVVHVVDFEVASLLNPILDEWIAQGVFGF